MAEIQFYYPASVDEAVGMLSSHSGSRCIAGGQTLVAMMNAGLLETPALVALSRIDELSRITVHDDGRIRIGAAVSHRDVAHSPLLKGANAAVRAAAAVIAHPAIRNFGTIGGSMAHADPAADYPTAVVAAGALVEIAGTQGRRIVKAEDFFLDYLTTVLEPGEMVTAILLPPSKAGSVGHYLKFSRVDGDYAIASVGVTLSLENDVCTAARLAIGGSGAIPIFSPEANKALVGSACGQDEVSAAAAHILECVDPVDDVRASAEYRKAILPKLLQRAVSEAMSIAKGGVMS